MRIEIPVKMVSENTALRCIVRGKYASPTKSATIKNFEKEVRTHLIGHITKLKGFTKKINPNKHGIKLSVINRTPNFFTAKGTISHRSIDVDNIKYLVDSLAGVAEFNDSQILELNSFKEYAESHSIVIHLSLIEF